MISWRRNLFIVWFSQILCSAAFAAILPYIPLYLRDAFDITDISVRGAWVAAFSFSGQLGIAMFVPVWGSLADRYGRKIMLMRAYLVSAILIPMMALMPAAFMLVILRFFVGAFAGTINAAQTLICSTTPEHRHGFALGTLSSGWWSGNMMGFMIGGFVISKWGYTWSFIICGLMLFLALVMVFFLVEDNFVPRTHERNTRRRERLQKVSRVRRLLPRFGTFTWSILIVLMLTGLARSFESPYIALLVEKINGIDGAPKWTGVISATTAAAAILSGPMLGLLCDRLSPAKIVIPAAIGAGVMLLCQGAAASLFTLGGARFFHYFMAGGIEPVFQTMLSRATPPGKRGTVFGFAACFRSIGMLTSMAISGYIIYNFGVRFTFFTSAAIFFALAPIMFIVIRRKR